jgi:hypothetical protein
MGKLYVSELPVVPDNSQGTLQRIITRLYELLRESSLQVNNLAEGSIFGRYAARPTIPTVGNYKQGDITWDNAPVEAGIATAKYVRLGWVCVASGAPGTWREIRTLTGN